MRAHASEKSNGAGPAAELRAASTPKYLGEQSARVGIHDKQRMSAPDESAARGQALTPEQVEVLQQNVASAMAARIEPGGRYCKPDEHRFQSLLRRDPSVQRPGPSSGRRIDLAIRRQCD